VNRPRPNSTPAPYALLQLSRSYWLFSALWVCAWLTVRTKWGDRPLLTLFWVAGFLLAALAVWLRRGRIAARVAAARGMICTHCLGELDGKGGQCPSCGEPYLAERVRAAWHKRWMM
jgi:hypothetical protein